MAKHDNKIRIPDQRTTTEQTTSGIIPIEHGRVLQSSRPGESCLVSFFAFRAVGSDPGVDSYAHAGWTDIPVYDPFFQNCAVTNELVTCYWDTDRHRMQFLGSNGLIRQVIVTEINPGSGDTVVLTCTLSQDPTVEIEITLPEADDSILVDSVLWAKYLPGDATESIYSGTITGRTVEAIKKGNWTVLSEAAGGDPDTPFRQTVETSIANLARGHTAPIYGDASDLTFDALHLLSGGGGAGTANGAAHGQSVAAGTLGFFNEQTGVTTPVLKKTSDGGFAPAIIYMLSSNHNYAVCDSRLAQPSSQRFLISTPYGPYRILAYKDLDPEVSTFPKFVYASIKDQTQDRDVSFYPVSALTKISNNYMVRFDATMAESSAGNDSSRMVFPELKLEPNSSPTYNRITRRYFNENAPHPLYIYRLIISGLARREDNGTYTSEDLFTFNDTGSPAAARTIRFYRTLRYKLRTWFMLANNSEVFSDTPIYLSELQAFVAGYGYVEQSWIGHTVGYWPEFYKEMRFEIQPWPHSGGATYPDVNLSHDGGGSTDQGYGSLMIYRCGDRGAHPNSGSRTLAGFTTVVSEPEPP